MIQITPQMRILVAIEPADFRRGIDGLGHAGLSIRWPNGPGQPSWKSIAARFKVRWRAWVRCAWSRSGGRLTDERLQAWLLDSSQAEEQAAPAEKTNRRGPRAERSGRSVAERRSGNRRP